MDGSFCCFRLISLRLFFFVTKRTCKEIDCKNFLVLEVGGLVAAQGSRKPHLIVAPIITTPTNCTHSFIQVMSYRKDKTMVFLSNEPKSLCLCSAVKCNCKPNSVQAIFYYIMKQMIFITISRFIQINNVKLIVIAIM